MERVARKYFFFAISLRQWREFFILATFYTDEN